MIEKNCLIQLTQNLYRLTLLFPKKEPLRYKMRELADEIFQKIVSGTECIESLEVLDGYFEVAKSQNWVSPNEILKLKEEYSKLKQVFKNKVKNEGQISASLAEVRPLSTPSSQSIKRIAPTGGVGINERKKKILDFLKEQSPVQVWQVKEIFPDVSKRTLRRDFNDLVKQGIIERIGERNNTFYQIKRSL